MDYVEQQIQEINDLTVDKLIVILESMGIF